ncbi:DsbA family protein [Streptomyces sp. NPDC002564]|uniref:DsbA family protein n=1 Tax=Streptomyces sp. NPDC002564 TaxID=3364649 RepID=UPI0036A7EB6F
MGTAGGRVAVAAACSVLMVAGCATKAEHTEGEAAASSASSPRQHAYADVDDLPEKLAADGTTVMVGDPGAATAVQVYSDPRCPVVEEFESTGARALREMTLRHKIRTEYTLASFRDDRVGGDGSKRAVNALRAALERGKFAAYYDVLFENMIENEMAGGYTTASLLELADQIPGLRNKTFDAAVRTMKYERFVAASQTAYEKAGGDKEPRGPGTPTVAVNDARLRGTLRGLLFDQELFHQYLAAAPS